MQLGTVAHVLFKFKLNLEKKSLEESDMKI